LESFGSHFYNMMMTFITTQSGTKSLFLPRSHAHGLTIHPMSRNVRRKSQRFKVEPGTKSSRLQALCAALLLNYCPLAKMWRQPDTPPLPLHNASSSTRSLRPRRPGQVTARRPGRCRQAKRVRVYCPPFIVSQSTSMPSGPQWDSGDAARRPHRSRQARCTQDWGGHPPSTTPSRTARWRQRSCCAKPAWIRASRTRCTRTAERPLIVY
jgi:hypothetical protein